MRQATQDQSIPPSGDYPGEGKQRPTHHDKSVPRISCKGLIRQVCFVDHRVVDHGVDEKVIDVSSIREVKEFHHVVDHSDPAESTTVSLPVPRTQPVRSVVI